MITSRTFIALVLLAAPMAVRADLAPSVVTPTELQRVVDVRGVRATPDGVHGQLVNLTDNMLENVKLVVEDTFLWSIERHPGPESPGRASTVLIDRVPPHGAVDFTIDRPEPPDRPDGHFETVVRVLGLTERPLSPTAAAPAPTGSTRTERYDYGQ